jgi:hypothetical protein
VPAILGLFFVFGYFVVRGWWDFGSWGGLLGGMAFWLGGASSCPVIDDCLCIGFGSIGK